MIVGQVAYFYEFVRLAAALGGAILGYFLSGPIARLLCRGAFQRPLPVWVLPPARLVGGVLIGALVYFLVTLGGGGGWGWGTGSGTGSAGNGEGKDKTEGPVIVKPGKGQARTKLDIELLGGNRVTAEGRYYLIQRQPPAKTIEEVEVAVKDQADKLEVNVVKTDESVADSHPAVARLLEMLRRYHVSIVERRE